MNKSALFLIVSCLALFGCPSSSKHPYEEDCPEVNIQGYPIILRGFQFDEIDTVVIKTFKRNSNFRSLVETIFCYQENHGQSSSPTDIDPPKPLWTTFDWQIIVSDSIIFSIDNFLVKSEPHVPSGYECQVVEYRLNGKIRNEKNIGLWKPGTIQGYDY